MNRRCGVYWLVVFLAVFFVGCQASTVQPVGSTETPGAREPSLVEQAALEATRIVQEAQATAMVMQAQAQATALFVQASAATPAPTQPATDQSSAAIEKITTQDQATSSKPTTTPIPVEVLSVGFAADGGMLIVRFMAPKKEAEKWWQGSTQVIQESSQQVYEDIPVMPIIGPLISRPKQDGQAGYVMLYHNPALLQTGDLVTVILGNYKFEHVEVSK